jgi:RNA polymerase-binding protein DksA
MARTTARTLAGRTVAAAKRVAGTVAADPAPKKTAPAKRAATKKAAATTTPAKKAPAKKSPAPKAAAAMTKPPATAKKVATQPTKKATATKKAPVTKKAPSTKVPAAKQAPAAKKAAPAGRTSRKTATRASARGPATAAADLAVKSDEKPWTAAELTEVRDDLHGDRDRLRSELNLAEHELHDLMRDAGDGAGNDQADVGSTTFERDHEMSLANNARDMLAQTERALARIDDGSYGVCESCGQPIGKMRVMAFPRATLCLTCKQREERR